MSETILVTDGEERVSLAIARSLGQAGHAVYVCSPRGRSLAGASRYVREEVQVPDPYTAPQSFVSAVADLVRTRRVGILIPATDASLLALLPARGALHGARIPFPSESVHRRLSDKATVLECAAALGIPTPEQRIAGHPEDAARLADDAPPFPLVVKPARSLIQRDGVWMKTRARQATDPKSLVAVLAQYPPEAFPLLIQRRIVGPGLGVFLLVWERQLLAAFAHRRIREKPPAGGVSVYRESVPLEPDQIAESHRLLERFGWQGVAMVEYKVEASTGTPYLMEVNPRFWGSLQLAVDAGVDFPALLVAAALGDRPRPVLTYEVGVRTRWWWGDVDHLLARLRAPADDLGLPVGTNGRGRALLEFLRWRRVDREEVLRLDDARPFFHETAAWFRAAFNGQP